MRESSTVRVEVGPKDDFIDEEIEVLILMTYPRSHSLLGAEVLV